MINKNMVSILIVISIVGSSIVSLYTLNSPAFTLTSNAEKFSQDALLDQTISQARQLNSLLGETVSVVEASAKFAEQIFSNSSIPSVTSYYHNKEVNNYPPDLFYDKIYGREISTNFSAYKIAPTAFNSSYQSDYLNNDPETKNPLDYVNSTIRNVILESAKLDLIWRELYNSFPGHVWLYMGFELGFHRSFPWHSYSKSYDPRIRPWYVGAVTGAKDVVVVLDTSGSMGGDPIANTKEAVKNVFKTLGPRDRLSVLSFESDISIYNDDLEIYSNVLQKQVNGYVDGLNAGGSTNINEALTTALNILKNKGSEDRTPVLIFMTDGKPTVGELNTAEILNNVQSSNDFGAKIFVFGLGTGVDENLLKSIADQNFGAAVFIADSEDIPDAMNRYYKFFTDEVKAELLWSYPYIDQSGFGMIITATKPVVVNNKFYGVISADLTLTRLIDETKAFNPSENGYTFIFDSAGVMVVHPDILKSEPADWTVEDVRIPIESFETQDNSFLELKEQAMSGLSGIRTISYSGDKRLVAFAPIGNTSLRFASVLPQGDLVPLTQSSDIITMFLNIPWLFITSIGIGAGVFVFIQLDKCIKKEDLE